jgi:hypothetical protein
MANTTLQGTIKKIHDTITKVYNEKEYKTRVLWLEEAKDQYPSVWSLETSGDKTLLLDTLKEGDVVDCKIDIVGRSYTTKDGEEKVFNSLKCFGINKVSSAPVRKDKPMPPPEKDLSYLPMGTMTNEEADSQLPF